MKKKTLCFFASVLMFWQRALMRVAVVALVLCGLGMPTPAFAEVIAAGIDVWATPDDRQTYVDVELPAGFFCGGLSAYRAERLYLKGQPIATYPAGALGNADTIILRPDDGELVDGVATIRLHAVALNLVGRSDLLVPCPDNTEERWQIQVRADGPQDETGTLVIHKSHANGGTFDSVFSVNGRIDFVNADTEARATPLFEEVHLSSTGSVWSHAPGSQGIDYPDQVDVDVDGDGEPDEDIPGTSNFHPGWSPAPAIGCAAPCPRWIRLDGPHGNLMPACWPACDPILNDPEPDEDEPAPDALPPLPDYLPNTTGDAGPLNPSTTSTSTNSLPLNPNTTSTSSTSVNP